MLSLSIVAALLIPAWLIGVLLYRGFFHPLARYPGPFLAKFTGWAGLSAVLEGRNHVYLLELHEKYGPVVRIGPNRLSYNTVEAVQKIYADRRANVKKAGFVESIANLKGGHRNLQTINERHAYSVRRRLIGYAFSEEALRSSEQYVITKVGQWCKTLAGKAKDANSWTPGLDAKDWSEFLTQDILGELCFGEDFGAIERGESPLGDLATEGAAQAQKLAWAPLGITFWKLLKVYVDAARRNRWESAKPQLAYDDAIDSMMSRRMQLEHYGQEKLSEKPRRDFFSYLIEAKDPETGEKIGHDDLNVECGVLFGAGMDTSATTMAACLFYLTRNTEVLGKVTSEVRRAFPTGEDITWKRANAELPYLRACIDETLRMSPAVPGPLLREVLPGGLIIADHNLPAGTELSVPSYVIHHNELYFPQSFSYRPERWLDDLSGAKKEAFFPFSAGTRSCIGKSQAYIQMTLGLARLLFQFDIKLAEGTSHGHGKKQWQSRPGEYRLEDWFITARHGPVIQLKAAT